MFLTLPDRTRILLQIFLVLLFTVLAFYPSLKGGFIPLDDQVMVTENQQITSLSPGAIINMFTSSRKGLYHPIVTLSYAIEFNYFRRDPLVYRMTNLYLHAFNCLLVFWIFYAFTGNSWTAFIISLLFGVHPMHVESVAWISERKDVLYALFFFLSIMAYLNMMAYKKARFYVISLFFFVLSVLSKPMAVTLPVILALVVYYKNEEFNREHLWKLAPFFGLALIFSCVAYLVDYGPATHPGLYEFVKRAAGASYNYAFYFYKIVFPAKLYVLYPDVVNYNALTRREILTALTGVAAAALLLAYSARFTRKIVFGLGIFIFGLLPVIGLMPFGIATVADRYVYVPAIGLFYLFAEAVVKLYGALNRKAARYGLVLTAACVFCAFFLLARAKAGDWADGYKLFDETIKRYPMNSPEMYNCRGLVSLSNSDIEAARKDFEKVLSMDKKHMNGLVNLISVNSRKGDVGGLNQYFNAAAAIDPRNAVACVYMAKLHYNNKEYDKALYFINAALASSSRDVSLLTARAEIRSIQKNYTGAYADYTSILKLDPNNPEAHVYLGNCYLLIADLKDAESEYNDALSADRDNPAAYYRLGVATAKRGDLPGALKYYNKALRAAPGMTDVYRSRADAYTLSGDRRAALGDLITAYKLDPSAPTLLLKMSMLDYDMGKYRAARGYYNEALKNGCAPGADLTAKLNSITGGVNTK